MQRLVEKGDIEVLKVIYIYILVQIFTNVKIKTIYLL